MHDLHHDQTRLDTALPQRQERLDTNWSKRCRPPDDRGATAVAHPAATCSRQPGPPQRQGGTRRYRDGAYCPLNRWLRARLWPSAVAAGGARTATVLRAPRRQGNGTHLDARAGTLRTRTPSLSQDDAGEL